MKENESDLDIRRRLLFEGPKNKKEKAIHAEMQAILSGQQPEQKRHPWWVFWRKAKQAKPYSQQQTNGLAHHYRDKRDPDKMSPLVGVAFTVLAALITSVHCLIVR